METEKFEQQLFSKLKDVKRVSPSPTLFQQLSLEMEKQSVSAIPTYYWSIAASVAFLLLLNGATIFFASSQTKKGASENASVNTVVAPFTIYENE